MEEASARTEMQIYLLALLLMCWTWPEHLSGFCLVCKLITILIMSFCVLVKILAWAELRGNRLNREAEERKKTAVRNAERAMERIRILGDWDDRSREARADGLWKQAMANQARNVYPDPDKQEEAECSTE